MALHEWYVDQQLRRASGDLRARVRVIYIFQATMLVAATLSVLSLGTRLAVGTGLTAFRSVFLAFWLLVLYQVVRQHLYLRSLVKRGTAIE